MSLKTRTSRSKLRPAPRGLRAPKSSPKRDEILLSLRQRIVKGTLTPGTQLPTRKDIQEQFGVSMMTVQSALDQLAADGFVQSHGPRGTFVAETPPHLCRYGVVFPTHPGAEDWSRYYHAVHDIACGTTRYAPKQLAVFYNISNEHRGADWERLEDEVRRHQLAGLVFLHTPTRYEETDLLREPCVPRVAITDQSGFPNIHSVCPDFRSFVQLAVEHFRSHKRRRLAVLWIDGRDDDRHQILEEELRGSGLQSPTLLHQYVAPHSPICAQQVVRLLMSLPKAVRPDALLATDDHLLEGAAAGLADAKANLTRDLTFVGYQNFPARVASPPGVQLFGTDARVMLDICIRLLDQQRAGDMPDAFTFIPAVPGPA